MFKLPEDLESKYAFVSLASARAGQLQAGALPKIEGLEGRKYTVVAQEEIATGAIAPVDPDAEEEVAESEEEPVES